jgi:hypothetical protein
VSDSLGPKIFYSQREITVVRRETYLGTLRASQLEECSDEFWDTNLRLWTREELGGDTRRVEGLVEVKSPEDIADEMDENEFQLSWFVEVAKKLAEQWEAAEESDVFESFSEDVVLDFETDLSHVRWVIEGKLILEPGARLNDAIILAEEGVELRGESSLNGRVLSRGSIDLGIASKASGWWATLGEVNNDSSHATINMQGSEFQGTLLALSGPRSMIDDYTSFYKGTSSEFQGFLLSPYPVSIHGEFYGSLWAYSLDCGSGNNCLGDAYIMKFPKRTPCLQVAWMQDLEDAEGDELWTLQEWGRSLK